MTIHVVMLVKSKVLLVAMGEMFDLSKLESRQSWVMWVAARLLAMV